MEHNEFLLRPVVYCPECKVALTYVESATALHKMQLVHYDPAGHTMEDVAIFGSACPYTGVYEAPTVLLRKLESWSL